MTTRARNIYLSCLPSYTKIEQRRNAKTRAYPCKDLRLHEKDDDEISCGEANRWLKTTQKNIFYKERNKKVLEIYIPNGGHGFRSKNLHGQQSEGNKGKDTTESLKKERRDELDFVDA